MHGQRPLAPVANDAGGPRTPDGDPPNPVPGVRLLEGWFMVGDNGDAAECRAKLTGGRMWGLTRRDMTRLGFKSATSSRCLAASPS